jgi:CHAD domain-containing protein
VFRTTYRRFQVWSKQTGDSHNKEQAETVAYLDKVLKSAGKLRDAGLHLKMLKEVKLPRHQKSKAKFESILTKRCEKRRVRVRNLLEGAVLSEVWRALSGLVSAAVTTRSKGPGEQDKELKQLLKRYASSVHSRGVLRNENLHEYRLKCKEFRYQAELIGGAEADRTVKHFKRIQDAIGEWHDWLVLSELAQKELEKGPLSRSIARIEARKLARALRMAKATELKLLPAETDSVQRKPVQRSATHRPERASASSA